MKPFLVTVLLATKFPEDFTKKTVPPPGPISPTAHTPPSEQALESTANAFGVKAKLQTARATVVKRITNCLRAISTGLVLEFIWGLSADLGFQF
jgi:hypothetical protein